MDKKAQHPILWSNFWIFVTIPIMSDENKRAPYDHKDVELRIYNFWTERGYFSPEKLPGQRKESYIIIMPPPNANGDLHAGHALFITLEDIFIRYRRMRGYKALWIPGADHAGFETQVVYEKQLEKEGRSRFGMDQKQLYDEIYAFTLKNKVNMEDQVRRLGASCDWSREKFTLDPDVVARVQETFVTMYRDKLIYRKQRTINWCAKHQTSLSDVETENVEEKAKLYYFKYGPFEIATARPETKFGDKYVVMHPDDTRYLNWRHRETLEVEWINGPVSATVIKDPIIDMAFGTGVMTITPWHSQVDFEIAERHKLSIEQIIDMRGKLLPVAKEFAGMKIAEAREKIVEKLKNKGLLIRVDENYTHTVKRCYKCATMIEPQVKEQWFVKMEPLAAMALRAVERKEVRFVPSNYEKIFRYWMENTLDWNISRQIVWGIPIPAWFCDTCGEHGALVADEPPACPRCTKPMRKDSDTFDTWFSSGQWPLLVTGYPSGADYTAYYPTDLMETGHDLIFKWVPRMIIFGLYLAKKAPFHTVYLHGLVNDANGKKMSKSKGNVINPLDLTRKYGTDALRMALVVGNTPGTDLALREDKVKGYMHFSNKLWNASRFVAENIEDFTLGDTRELPPVDVEVIETCNRVISEATEDLENYRVYLAAEKLYHYAWHTFADVVIEESKSRLRSGGNERRSAQYILVSILDRIIRALHPFMPFITEEIWQVFLHQKLKLRASDCLMVAEWPTSVHTNKNSSHEPGV